MPVLHFGMTGMVQVRYWIATRNARHGINRLFSQVKGEPPTYYKEGSKSTSTEWPPRFVKVAHILLPINLELNFRNLTVHFASCRWRIKINYGVGFHGCSTSWAYTALYIALD
jgi:hypothetical protein